MPMNKNLYPPDWDEISLKRREQAGWKCEYCGAKQGEPHPFTGKKVVLTVHHVGVDKPDGTPGNRHDKMDVRPENLAALCQRCHWIADLDIHISKAQRARIERKYKVAEALEKGQRRMFDDE